MSGYDHISQNKNALTCTNDTITSVVCNGEHVAGVEASLNSRSVLLTIFRIDLATMATESLSIATGSKIIPDES